MRYGDLLSLLLSLLINNLPILYLYPPLHSNHLPAVRQKMEVHKKPTFLSLPAELRLEIYRNLLLANSPIDPINFLTINGIHPALLRTCRGIYHEARQILGENTFVLEARKVLFWLSRAKIIAHPLLFTRGCLSLPRHFVNYIVRVDLSQYLEVGPSGWEGLVNEIVDALVELPKIRRLGVEIIYGETHVPLMPSVPTTLPADEAKTIADCFRRLHGVIHAKVSGLGADGANQELEHQLMRS